MIYPRLASLTLSRSVWSSLALSVRPCLSEALWVSLDLSRSTSMYVCKAPPAKVPRQVSMVRPGALLAARYICMYDCTFPGYVPRGAVCMYLLSHMYVCTYVCKYVRHLLGPGCKVCTTAYFHGLYLLGFLGCKVRQPASQPASNQAPDRLVLSTFAASQPASHPARHFMC